MPCMTEVMDNDIFIRFLDYKEITTTIIDGLKEENAKLKKELEKAKRIRYTLEPLSLSDVIDRLPGKQFLNIQEEKK